MSDTSIFDWKLPPAQGQPGYQPRQPQAPQPKPPASQNYMRWLGPTQPTPKPIDAGSPEDPGDTGPVEPYIPSRNDRPYDQWATPDFAHRGAMNYPGLAPGPYMPQPRDLAPLLHGIVMGIGRWGSHYSGMPAIAMGTYASAYWKAYQAGMHERAGTAWQQYKQAQEMFLDRQAEELRAAKDIYALYQDDPNRLHEELYQLAGKYQDAPLRNAIESGNYGAIDKLFQERDKSWQDAAKIKAQQEKQAQEAEERRLRIEWYKKRARGEELPPEWGGHGTGGGGSDEAEPPAAPQDSSDGETGETGDGTGDQSSRAPTTEPPSSPDEETPDGKPPIRYAEADTGTKTDASPIGGGRQVPAAPHVATPEEVSKRIDDYARAQLRGEAAPKNIPKSIASRIEARRGELENQLDGIIASDATGKDMLDKVRAFDPEMARTIEAIVSGRRTVPTAGGLSAGAGPLWNKLTDIASAVRPGWGPEIAAFRREFVSANGATQKSLLAATSMTGAAERVLKALQYIGEDETPPENFINQIIANKFTGDPRWINLGQALNSYTEESAKLARGGQSAEGDINRILDKFAPMGMGPKGVRALLANEAGVAAAQVQAKLNQWKNATWEKTPPIGYDSEAFGFLRSLENLDMMTGTIPKGIPVPESIKPYLGRSGSKANEKPSPALPAGAPEGSRIGTDKTGKKWLVDPDGNVLREIQ